MKMLYTANGRYIRCCTEEGTRPVIIVCEKEYEVDVQEFMLWSILNWRILREEEISSFYEKMASSSNVTIHRSWQDCVQRLLVRGLLVVGTGDTEYDALYDLLSCRFIIPIGAAWPLRVLSFLKLTFLEGISWKITRRLFHVDARSACEKKVIRHCPCGNRIPVREIQVQTERNSLRDVYRHNVHTHSRVAADDNKFFA